MTRFEITTIHELLNYHYGGSQEVRKDDPVISTTTGVFNAVFGAMAWSQLNAEANVFALLPKYPWQHSGFRAITADAGSSGTGTITEAGAVPATAKPTFQEITIKVAEVAHSFDVSYRQEGFVKAGDDAFGTMVQLRPYFAALHAKRINEMLLAEVDTAGLGEQHGSFETLDRVTANTAAGAAGLYTVGDEDIYAIDRSAAAWADAVVSHNSTVDRTLTISLIEDTLATLEGNGARTNVIVTGNDTKWRIISLAQTQVRYQGVVDTNGKAVVGINGVDTEDGIGFGVKVATIYGIPMFSSQAVQQDTISRIYLLDTTTDDSIGLPRLGLSMLYPTLYFESGMSAANPNPFAINKFATEGVYYTAGQTVCLFFAAQGSIRDLK